MASHLQIHPHGLKMVLFQTMPGMEVTVGRQLKSFLSKLKRDRKIERYGLWKIFGTYDILCAYQVTRFAPDLLYCGVLWGVQRSTEIFAFAWDLKTSSSVNPSFNFEDLVSKPVLGLSLHKIDPAHLCEDLKLEEKYVRAAAFGSDQERLPTLGTLGWNEIVHLVSGDEVSDVVAKIHNQSLKTLAQVAPNDFSPFFADSFTIVGIRFDLVTNRRKRRHYLTAPFGESAISVASGYPWVELAIHCRPDRAEGIAEGAITQFDIERASIALGQEDVVISLRRSKLSTWGQFVDRLLEFRDNGIQGLTDTAVRIRWDIDTKRPQPHPTADAAAETRSRALIITDQELKAILKLGHPSAETFLTALYSFNGLLSQDLLDDCFYDLIEFAHNVLDCAQNNTIGDLHQEDLATRFEMFAFAVEQRALTLSLGFEFPAGGRLSPFRGGMQRVLYALNTVPKRIVEEICEQRWPGFPVVGFNRRYSHCGEIVNLPVHYVFDPARWWGVAHEAFHAHLTLAPDWFPHREIQEKLLPRFGDLEVNANIVNIKSAVIDVLDFRYVFRRDWSNYLKTLWEYLLLIAKTDELIDTRIDVYLWRSFVVYFIERFNDGDAKELVSRDQVEKMYDEFVSELFAAIAPNTADKKTMLAQRDNVLLEFAKLRSVMPLMAELAQRYEKLFKKIAGKASQARTRRAIAVVEQGRIADGDFDPVALCMALGKDSAGGESAFPKQIATIISLWRRYMRNYATPLRR